MDQQWLETCFVSWLSFVIIVSGLSLVSCFPCCLAGLPVCMLGFFMQDSFYRQHQFGFICELAGVSHVSKWWLSDFS